MKKELKDLNRGDIFKEEMSDTAGSEQKGYRPYLVVSDYSFNNLNGYAIVCPLSKQKYEEPDGISVETVNSLVSGYVLTQHISPYYPNYVTKEKPFVKVVDSADENTLNKCLKVFKAISTLTSFKTRGFSQGEIIQFDHQDERLMGIVLSENSFNQTHNSIWVAPILVEAVCDGQADHVCLNNKDLFNGQVGIIYLEAFRNIHSTSRNVKKLNVTTSNAELKKCLDILNIFFE